MRRYAQDTKVTASKTREDIEATLQRYGAKAFGFMQTSSQAIVTFQCQDRLVRFVIGFVDPVKNPQEHRRIWRALALCIKSKLESVASSIESFDEAFLAHIVLPNGRNVSDQVIEQIAEAYESPDRPAFLSLGFDPPRTPK